MPEDTAHRAELVCVHVCVSVWRVWAGLSHAEVWS